MIDRERLQAAYRTDGIYALQLEVGDLCHQGCVYCYMNALTVAKNTLSDAQITRILQDARRLNIAAVEWLGGEPLLRRSIFRHMALARDLGLRNNIWTGGLPLADDRIRGRAARLARHGLISVHVSTVDPTLYARLHPQRGADDLVGILQATEDLLQEGYPAAQILNSVTFTGLQPAADTIETIDCFEERFGIKTSLNVYHTYLRSGSPPGELERFIPARREVARVYRRFSRQWGVRGFPMNCVNKQYCSATIAVLCDGQVTPCATIRGPEFPSLHPAGSLLDVVGEHRDTLIFKSLKSPGNLPAGCRDCRLGATCWGCRSRAYAAGFGINGPDPRCFRVARSGAARK
jgi:radical SAM protein with 4Fe4S-binding SPASM domain